MRTWTDGILQRAHPTLAAEVGRAPSLEEAITSLVERGSDERVTRAVSADAWCAHLATHLEAPGDLHAQIAAMQAGDVHLILASLAGDARAIAELDQRLRRVAPHAFAGKRLSSADEEDLLQTVRARLLVSTAEGEPGKLAGYSGRGPLDAWLRVTLTREAISKLRSASAKRLVTSTDDDDAAESRRETDALERAAADDPELAVMRARYGSALKGALDESMRALPDEERTLLREHYVEGLTIDDLAAVYNTHRATAARRLARARHRVLEGARERMMTRLGVGANELASLLGALVSGLDWTMRAAFDAAREESIATAPDEPTATTANQAKSAGDDDEPALNELGTGVIVAGRYELTEFLGAGASALVWAARIVDGHGAGSEVALKIARSNAPDFLHRFEREARIATTFVHPYVARTYEVLPSTRARGPILVQELVRGETLEMRLSVTGPLPVPTMAQIALPIAEALAAAHAQGIVHRDLKPQNVAITEAGRVAVLDFGLAKLLPAFGEATRLTRSGAQLGTPRYMAPEQLAGERDVDARADVWAFGSLVHRLLIGHPPIDATTAGEAMRALSRPLPQLEALMPHAPPELCALTDAALVVDRKARLATLDPFVPVLRKLA